MNRNRIYSFFEVTLALATIAGGLFLTLLWLIETP